MGNDEFFSPGRPNRSRKSTRTKSILGDNDYQRKPTKSIGFNNKLRDSDSNKALVMKHLDIKKFEYTDELNEEFVDYLR